MIRLSIPGNACGCGAIMGEPLVCPGCGHVDPLTFSSDTSPFKNTDDWYPPQVEYPEDHSPMCHRSCTHPCHEPYDEWKKRQP